ncbi:MAG: PQQ-binding-like beta-propeller repeat protein [Candidatus Riflebacteria bacterium]|nr:PQQ-binding-like beta-propeller repeat protein [Candidatus Riflebacteria bacterium]
MDEIPIISNNPINFETKNKQAQKTNIKSSKKITFKDNVINWFYMLPLAFVVFVQLYIFGSLLGAQTTFSIFSFSSLIYLGIILAILFFIQMMMRSMLFSMFAGIAILFGLFNAWFGDFLIPLFDNIKNISEIIQAAWSKKSLPYELLVSGSMSALLVTIIIAQFFLSLIIKSFFEIFFGKEWGNGRVYGYAGAIVFMLFIQLTFSGYRYYSSDNSEKLIWKHELKYNPIEKFISKTPNEYLIGEDKIWLTDSKNSWCLDAKTGKVTSKRSFRPGVVHNGFKRSSLPVFLGNDALYVYNDSLNISLYKTDYPIELEKVNVPLTSYEADEGKSLLVFFDYGYVGFYGAENGNLLWLKQIDLPIAANRSFPDKYLEEGYYLEEKDRFIFSCNNGIIKCLSKENGNELWQYEHSTPKVNGISLRALLSKSQDRFVAAFKTGEIFTFNISDGKKLYQSIDPHFEVITPVNFEHLEGDFFAKNGIYYKIKLDGGIVISTENTLKQKNEYVPVICDINNRIIINGGKITKVNENGKAEVILNENRRTFITQPKFDDKIIYVGSADGWVYCIHTGSAHIKWKVKADGELAEDSLFILKNNILVKTKSGSLFCYNKEYGN